MQNEINEIYNSFKGFQISYTMTQNLGFDNMFNSEYFTLCEDIILFNYDQNGMINWRGIPQLLNSID